MKLVLFCMLTTVLSLQLTTSTAKHVFIPRPDTLEIDLMNSGRFNEKHIDKRMSKWYHTFQRQSCGQQEIQPRNPLFKILGGQSAIPGSWPWMVSIYTTVPFSTHWCGGSLISDQWVLTAAHCRDWITFGRAHYDNFTVRAGKNLLFELEEGEEDMGIEQFEAHPLFNMFDYDIALIKLKRPIRWKKNISPLCLPEIQSEPELFDEELIASGWGITTASTDADYSPVLRQVALPLIDWSRCQKFPAYTGIRSLTKREFCAGYINGQRDTCAGDSGSPLQYRHNGRWTVKGVVSRGGTNRTDCGHPFKPTVFTDVHQVLPWILWHIFLFQ